MSKLYSALILLSLIWGTSFLFMKILLFELDPAAIVFGRCLFGTIMLFIVLLFSKEKIHLKNLPWFKLFFVALFNNALPWLFICSSETKITTGLASGINATTPVWTLIIGFLFFSAPLKKNQWAGIIIGFIGIFVLSGIKLTDFFSSNTLGVFLMVGAALFYGIGGQLSKRGLSLLTVLQTSFFTLALSTLISFVAMVSLAPSSLEKFNHSNLLFPFIGLGAFGSGIAYLLYYYLVKKGSPELASLVTYIVPVSAIAWGAVILKETIHLTMIFGLIIILLGVYISSRRVNTEAETEAAV